ncbi:MAG TPA: SDR family oxidoreductase [Candidatus Limnocylindrales bacterium]|nr:SDR family oxidoreductase [Candidatus Limnocylindrales bacterium]
MRILIVGASGYIGGRLAGLLAAKGHELVLMSRDARPLAERFGDATIAAADLLDPESLDAAVEGVEVAYYLAHSMGSGERGFSDRDRRAARNFAGAAARAGVGRIVYLGGLGDDDDPDLSPHLISRHLTGAELAMHGVPVTEFRAAIIIGSGSASFEILRNLTERLPIMITPRWVRTRCQPIGIRDVLDYLVGALDHPEITGIVEIGGPDVLSYGEMMQGYAEARGLHRLMIPVPVLTPRLSSYWVSLVSPVPAGIARPLIEGLRNEVVVRDTRPAEAFGLQPLAYAEAVRRAIDRTDRHEVESTWFDSLDTPDREDLPTLSSHEGMLMERRQKIVDATPDHVFAVVERLGGAEGWPYANFLWRVRGAADRMVGGIGMRLGRRSPDSLRVGDALDFWRVEAVRRPNLLRLRAEMKVPGRAWLQYEVEQVPTGSRLIQTAFFEPKGLPGLTYWYGLYPIHGLIFRGMVRNLAQQVDGEAESPGPRSV